tara:strand:+ start:1042 stop:1278 length:237 start_codon:yes stop_codon:yes gene_type:complete
VKALADIRLIVDKVERRFDKNYDKDIFKYCVYRRNVICPGCGHTHEIVTIEEQFCTEWQCKMCLTKFEETPTHTIIKE